GGEQVEVGDADAGAAPGDDLAEELGAGRQGQEAVGLGQRAHGFSFRAGVGMGEQRAGGPRANFWHLVRRAVALAVSEPNGWTGWQSAVLSSADIALSIGGAPERVAATQGGRSEGQDAADGLLGDRQRLHEVRLVTNSREVTGLAFNDQRDQPRLDALLPG